MRAIDELLADLQDGREAQRRLVKAQSDLAEVMIALEEISSAPTAVGRARVARENVENLEPLRKQLSEAKQELAEVRLALCDHSIYKEASQMARAADKKLADRQKVIDGLRAEADATVDLVGILWKITGTYGTTPKERAEMAVSMYQDRERRIKQLEQDLLAGLAERDIARDKHDEIVDTVRELKEKVRQYESVSAPQDRYSGTVDMVLRNRELILRNNILTRTLAEVEEKLRTANARLSEIRATAGAVL